MDMRAVKRRGGTIEGEERELIGLGRQNMRLRENLENGSQRDFIIDQSLSRGGIGKQKEKFETQYQKYEESGSGTISDNEDRKGQFPLAAGIEFVDHSQQDSERERNLDRNSSQEQEKENGRPIIKQKRRYKASPLGEKLDLRGEYSCPNMHSASLNAEPEVSRILVDESTLRDDVKMFGRLHG